MVFRDVDAACCSACVKPLEMTKNELKCDGCKLERYCSEACRRSSRRVYHSSEGECAVFEAALEAEDSGRREAANEDNTTTTTTSERGFYFEDVPQRFLVRVLSQAGKWRGSGQPMTSADVDAILALEAHVPPRDSPEYAWLSAISRNTLRLMDESVHAGIAFQPAAAAAAAATKPDPRQLLEEQEGGERQPPKKDEEEEGVSVRCHFGVPQLTRLMCCVNRNSHTLYAREEWPLEPVGTAVYLQGSAFNHSCRPNAEFYNDGTSLRVRSVRHIRAGEEATVSYVPLTQSLAERRRDLSTQFKFTCRCERCQQEEEEERGGATKRAKLNDYGDAAEPSRRCAVLEQHLNMLSRELAGEDENVRRAVLNAISEVCDLHAEALDVLKFGSEPALRLMHVVKRLDESLSLHGAAAVVRAAIERMKVASLKRALGFAAVARGEDHSLCVEINAALSGVAKIGVEHR